MSCVAAASMPAQAQTATPASSDPTLGEIVVSGSRSEQRRFDVPGAIDAVEIDPMRLGSPLVNLSELMSAVQGTQVRNRENYAQDLQLSVRGFGTRSTFGVRGVRILIDGIPATQPDGQGQAATASLTSAKRIEVLRGPVAQLYGNAAGGVVQVFTADAPERATLDVALMGGSFGQHREQLRFGARDGTLGLVANLSRYHTDGFREHSAATRDQLNAKVTNAFLGGTATVVLNVLNQPDTQDPLGLSRAQFEADPRGVDPAANAFDTRKTVRQHQLGAIHEARLAG
ncbi:MAG TPA: TonB-dependent receptor plug domain-containing protein, partial [Noviherbaspirillum sp.]